MCRIFCGVRVCIFIGGDQGNSLGGRWICVLCCVALCCCIVLLLLLLTIANNRQHFAHGYKHGNVFLSVLGRKRKQTEVKKKKATHAQGYRRVCSCVCVCSFPPRPIYSSSCVVAAGALTNAEHRMSDGTF